ncbi:hypothetical protein NFJ02_12g10360 [Pycnococcus provasolii]
MPRRRRWWRRQRVGGCLSTTATCSGPADRNNHKIGRNQAEVVAWLINRGATIPHYYRSDDLQPVSDDDWEIEEMCTELEWLVAKEWDVALAVLLHHAFDRCRPLMAAHPPPCGEAKPKTPRFYNGPNGERWVTARQEGVKGVGMKYVGTRKIVAVVRRPTMGLR